MSRIWQRQIEIDDEDLADQLQRISISSSIENRLDSVDQCVKSLMTEKKESTVDEGVVKDVVDSLVDNFLLEELFIHKKFAQLDESRIAQIFTTPRNVVHVSKHNQELTTEMIMCLRDGVWLNDEVINFHISMMQERNSKSTTSPVIFFHNSFFYCKLVSNGRYCYSNVSRWTKRKKVDIFACDIIMFPVHVHGNHWCLGAFDFRSKEIRYYDSLGGRNSEFFIHSRAYIKDEHQDKKGRPIELSDWKDVYPPKIPQQRNGCDCGVFALKFADFLSEDLPLSFSQTDMPYFRRRMILEITSGSIL